MEQIKALISEQGWTPQVKVRGSSQKQYLYAVRRNRLVPGHLEWCYLGIPPQVEEMSEEEILAKLVTASR